MERAFDCQFHTALTNWVRYAPELIVKPPLVLDQHRCTTLLMKLF
jgi:hypothetical protein